MRGHHLVRRELTAIKGEMVKSGVSRGQEVAVGVDRAGSMQTLPLPAPSVPGARARMSLYLGVGGVASCSEQGQEKRLSGHLALGGVEGT